MNIYLIQHAEAKSKEEDPERSITQEGKNNAEKVFSYFCRFSPSINEIWHSGKKRAEQTAVILSKKLNLAEKLKQQDNMNPADDVILMAKKLNMEQKNIALVGHMPFLKHLASYLLTGKKDQEIIRFQNTGIVCLSRKDSGWEIAFCLPPGLVK